MTDHARLKKYEAALKLMWLDQPNHVTQHRYQCFIDSRRFNKVLWLRWVENNAEKIAWCQELVMMAVTEELMK